MSLTNLFVFLAVGAVAGWLAGHLLRGGGFGLLANVVIGVFGSVVGGHLFSTLGISTGGLMGSIVTATVGAILLIYVIGILKRV